MRKKRELITMEPTEPNMTSMIDVVFLLISFFTLVMNFSQAEQHEEIALPKSELAQPPETAPPEMITLQILPDQTIVVGSKRCALEMGDVRASSFSAVLKDELDVLHTLRRVQPADVTIVIRGDADLPMGFVQRRISACQDRGADNFVLRARQAVE